MSLLSNSTFPEAFTAMATLLPFLIVIAIGGFLIFIVLSLGSVVGSAKSSDDYVDDDGSTEVCLEDAVEIEPPAGEWACCHCDSVMPAGSYKCNLCGHVKCVDCSPAITVTEENQNG